MSYYTEKKLISRNTKNLYKAHYISHCRITAVPDDYIISTGETDSIRKFVKLAFQEISKNHGARRY